MANVGALIPTPSGLGTVVQVLPGHIDPTLSQVVTEPIGGNGSDALPPEYFGTPLPGQAQSAASFVQTLILPSDSGSADTSSASAPTATPSPQEAPTATTSGTVWSSSDNSTTAPGESASQSGGATDNTSAAEQSNATTAPLPSQAFAQVASAYQTAQQRGSENAQRAVMVG